MPETGPAESSFISNGGGFRLGIALALAETGEPLSRFSPERRVATMRSMADAAIHRYTGKEYLSLVEDGVLQPDDRVELLEGVIVAMSPQDPRHASVITLLNHALTRVIAPRAVVRVQLPLLVGAHSVPEPDLAVVPGSPADYFHKHPTTALLVIEIADSSLAPDRLTKGAMYAAAGIPEYWIVNLRDDCVEVLRRPDAAARLYVERRVTSREDKLDLLSFPDVHLRVDDLIPARD